MGWLSSATSADTVGTASGTVWGSMVCAGALISAGCSVWGGGADLTGFVSFVGVPAVAAFAGRADVSGAVVSRVASATLGWGASATLLGELWGAWVPVTAGGCLWDAARERSGLRERAMQQAMSGPWTSGTSGTGLGQSRGSKQITETIAKCVQPQAVRPWIDRTRRRAAWVYLGWGKRAN
jgi:hypothetical protein